ncbi:MAG: hypothetical protein M1118_04375 [Chloroflexi bacterium]|nr:hypothetical protein [Chloroflexota bacterium]
MAVDTSLPPLLDQADRRAPEPGTSSFTTVIEPSKGWAPLRLGALWRYRELLSFLSWRDIKILLKRGFPGSAPACSAVHGVGSVANMGPEEQSFGCHPTVCGAGQARPADKLTWKTRSRWRP